MAAEKRGNMADRKRGFGAEAPAAGWGGEVGRRQWKKGSGSHRQGSVESTFFRHKEVLGVKLRARGARSAGGRGMDRQVVF